MYLIGLAGYSVAACIFAVCRRAGGACLRPNILDGEPGGVNLRGNDTNFHAYSINVCTLWMSEMVVCRCVEAGCGQNDQYMVGQIVS